jgi:predicted choloylglycine hydrolase
MSRLSHRSALILVLVLAVGCHQPPHKLSTAAKKSEPPFPVPVIEMSGTGDALGTAHASQLGGPIRNLFRDYFGRYFKSDFQRDVALLAASAFGQHVDPQHKAEIHALARGVNLDDREVMLGQCFLDLSAMTACSTITFPAGAAPDGVARFGRNLDFPSFNVADKGTVVLIFRPQGRYAFASIAWPGMIGVLSGMNEHGLTLANMEVDRGRRLPVAMPYTLLYRTVLERCRTVGEAIALLENTPRQTANNLMLMDASGDRAVVELTPEKVEVRRAPDDAALISTNHQRGQDLDEPGRCERYDTLHDEGAQQFGDIGAEQVESMLGDVAQGKMTLQSMVFEPAKRVLYLAVGANAPTKGYHRLELRKYFETNAAPAAN